MEHSIRFPLPLGVHIGFVVISVILLILCYAKKKHKYELYMLIGVASTMLVYICDTKPVFYILGLEEIILFGLTIADMVKVSKAENAAAKAKQEAKESNEAAEETSSDENSDSNDITAENEE